LKKFTNLIKNIRLFPLYIEHVITLIDNSKLGIKIGKAVINILLYADDVVLLANTLAKLQKIIYIVEKFGNELEIKFNTSKTNYRSINTHTKKNNTKKAKNNTVLRIRLAVSAMFKPHEADYDENLDAFAAM